MLKYSLALNELTKDDPDDCVAVVQENDKFNIQEVFDDITGPGSILKETEVSAVYHAMFKSIGRKMSSGRSFECEYLLIDHSIKGRFTNHGDNFDSNRHEVNTNSRLGSSLRTYVQDIPVEKIKSTTAAPIVEGFRDLLSKTVNDRITPNSFAEIAGENLKIWDTVDAAQGVFFISSQGAEIKVAEVSNNLPKKLTIHIPGTLKKGEYALEIRTAIRGGNKVRKGRLSETLVVV